MVLCVVCCVCDVLVGCDARERRVAIEWFIARAIVRERACAERVIGQCSSGGGARAAGVH